MVEYLKGILLALIGRSRVIYLGDKKREKALAGFMHEILKYTSDSVVDPKEMNAIRKRGYALLIDLGLDKDDS